MPHDWSHRIRLERVKRSWTQEHLAEMAGLSTRTIQRLENGADASAETIRSLATAFGITVDEFRASQLRKQFTAPWDRKLRYFTLGISVLLVAVMFLVDKPWSPAILLVIVLAMIFSVRGYTIKNGKLHIHRLGWSTTFDLAGLTGVSVNRQAMMGSLRMFGIGGIFGYVGYFRSPLIGTYRAFATHTGNCLVLEFGERKIVVTPDSPEAMECAINQELDGINR